MRRRVLESSRACAVVLALSALGRAQLGPPLALFASDASPLDQFGASVALSGSRALIGAPLDDDLGDASGSAYLFERVGAGWVEAAKLLASDGGAAGRFGWSVALDGDRALVGAPGPPGPPAYATYGSSGAVYVFERTGSAWSEVSRLSPPAPSGGMTMRHFGDGVSLSASLALVEADEALPAFPNPSALAFVFELGAGGWAHAATLSKGGAVAHFDGGAEHLSTALQGVRAVVGESSATPFGCHHHCGAAHVFEHEGGAWPKKATLVASPPYEGALLGCSVALAADAALVGAFNEFTPGAGWGTAHLYELAAGAWNPTAVLVPPPSGPAGIFGLSVALAGERALVGAPAGAGGAAFLYEKRCGEWVRVATLAPAGAGLADLGHVRFVALSDDTALAGAALDDAAGMDAGGARAFALGPSAIALSGSVLASVKTSHAQPAVATVIGELSVAALAGGSVEASFALSPAHAYLDGCWDFQWIEVVTSLSSAGVPLAADPALGLLPAIAPSASDGSDPFFHDALAWKSGQAGGATIHHEGGFSLLHAAPPGAYSPNETLELAAFLVAHDVGEGVLGAAVVSVLGGFAWHYSGATGESEVCQLLSPDPALVNAALASGTSGCPGHAGCPGFPGWSAVAGAALGPCQLLQGSPASISLSSGGVQKLSIDAGSGNAAEIYVLLGSVSGSAPGLAFGAYTLPLNADPYLAFTVGHPSTPPLAKSLGVLDANGRATATFTVPPGSAPALAGLAIAHAFTVLDLGLAPLVVSAAAALQLGP